MTDRVSVRVAGEVLDLWPERVAFWQYRRTLLMADMHIGKSAAFRRGGIPVPDPYPDDLARLSSLVSLSGADRLLVLGDLVHAEEGLTAGVVEGMFAWRLRHPNLTIGLVAGNHDRIDAGLLQYLGIDDLGVEVQEGPFLFRHDPEATPSHTGSYVLAGHVHPSANLRGGPWQSLRLPCFVIGRHRAILPAFGGFTGTARFVPRRDDRVFVIADDAVIEAHRGARSA